MKVKLKLKLKLKLKVKLKVKLKLKLKEKDETIFFSLFGKRRGAPGSFYMSVWTTPHSQHHMVNGESALRDKYRRNGSLA